MKVPFNDLYNHHSLIRQEIDTAISNVIDESSFIRGSHVAEFEERFASLIGTQHCISCANGTDALYIAVKALGLKSDQEVIVPAHSWISTSEIVTQAGGTVVFCDTKSKGYTIDVSKIREKITDKTVGIIPVHLFGQPADMDEIVDIAREFGLWIVEDCAQAHLATYKGKRVGTMGDAATFSFYPGKNLGALGDAGAIVCSDKLLAEHMAKFSRHGGLVKGTHDIEGINSRMDSLQAAILNVKLGYLENWTLQRQEAASYYLNRLSSVESVSLPGIDVGKTHVWHLFVIQHDDRDALALFLKNNGVQTVINYPLALPFLKAYERFAHAPSAFPEAHYNQSRILSLPIYPEIEYKQIDYVCSLIEEFASINQLP
jgi:dTDP-4-amino-4,6-dideoxygalactose transaminase